MSSQQLGKKLKEARKKLGLKQAGVSKKVGITTNYYARIERGEDNPTLKTTKKILTVLKIKSLNILSL
jgi:transcriptional regulator with XRE-family HTH domain